MTWPSPIRFPTPSDSSNQVLSPEIIDNVYKEGRDPRIYWGTATTGRPHCGYFVPATKIAQFLEAGCHVKILLADMCVGCRM